ncbi:E3 SUMO-protein ligase PIAS1 [Dothidotthia symphoricarpi CBS 119687]|uniref:E3 SUMO-protein ligase PIAS1 n=1 Tax=Dothidotthia symphoricarpi CBS 119687 TaxID=1392245 RepID=A0A6A6ABM9_9PLEO|nr:E3 SUMO-protein ligase PIAS1 [Dothidotthia symphoricarpi CBS 119687]KAF2128565.1 E3 SUMO-protein ligase PIAS1 [Dothidotthia symphoricarpi CBS 119687]
MATSLQSMATGITDRSKTLINNDLKKICKEEGVAQTGNKAALQMRVVGLIQQAVLKNDAEALRRLQHRVQNRGEAPLANSSSPAASSVPRHSTPPTTTYSMANGRAAPASYAPAYQPPQAPPRPTYFFKDSPFFEIRELLLGNTVLEASPSHRQNCTKNLILNEQVCGRLKSDPTLRVLLFSALEQPLAPYSRLDITFPSQIEVRLNGEEVKANYKGLKNKPGSTRPADITDLVRTTPANHRNTLVVTYALTQKASQKEKYNLFVYLVKKFSVEELTLRITQRNVITKQSVLNEMMKKANDPDIEVGSSVMSLKDPISTLRISTPCRSTICTHNQCFDADSFLQLQEQAPTWTCPICSKSVAYEGLAVDQYVEEILNKVRNLDQVTIKPTGEWTTRSEKSPPRHNGYGAHDDSEDDLVEIQDYRVRAIKTEAAPTPTSLGTPPLPSRETSTAPRSSTKRPIEVVDLISDDDEPPAKKVAYSTPSSLPDPSRRYQLPLPNASAHSRPLPPSYHSTSSGAGSNYPHSPSTPPSRNAYGSSYRPPPPGSRLNYPGHGTSTYPTYLGSSP